VTSLTHFPCCAVRSGFVGAATFYPLLFGLKIGLPVLKSVREKAPDSAFSLTDYPAAGRVCLNRNQLMTNWLVIIITAHADWI
jgi:hypothetical protein